MKPNLPPKPKSQETETRCNWTGPWQWDQQKILKIPFCWESDIPSNNNDNKEEVSLISGFFIIFALLVLPLKCRHAHFLSLSHIVFSAFFNTPLPNHHFLCHLHSASHKCSLPMMHALSIHHVRECICNYKYSLKNQRSMWFRLCLCARSFFSSPFCKHVCARVTTQCLKSLYLLRIG